MQKYPNAQSTHNWRNRAIFSCFRASTRTENPRVGSSILSLGTISKEDFKVSQNKILPSAILILFLLAALKAAQNSAAIFSLHLPCHEKQSRRFPRSEFFFVRLTSVRFAIECFFTKVQFLRQSSVRIVDLHSVYLC